MQSTLYVQRVCGTFLYYSIAVDQKMLIALNAIATAQAHAPTTTMGDLVWLLNHTDTHPDATLHYHSSNMILHVASDASYLCEERARSRAGGHFFRADGATFLNAKDNSDIPNPPLPCK